MEEKSKVKSKTCEESQCELPAAADDRCLIHERRDGKTKAELKKAGLLGDGDSSSDGFENADASRRDFQEAYLVDAELQESDLSWVILLNADLSDADLSGADLSWATLSNADLSGADLSGADLPHANLSWAILSNTDLLDVDLSWADLLGADLSGVDLLAPDEVDGDERERRLSSLVDLLAALLGSDDAHTINRGLRAVGEISDVHPEVCTTIVDPVHQAVDTTDSTVGKVSGIRALAAVALETNTSADAADETFADCLRAPDDYLRAEAVAALAPVVGEHPRAYPETIQALQKCATDGLPKETVPALQALAVVSATCPEYISADEFETAVDRLDGDPRVPDATVTDLQTAFRGVEQ